MFKVNRQDGAAQFINTEGDFVVTVSKVEEALDNKGREVCKVTFKTDDGSSTSDMRTHSSLWPARQCARWHAALQ